MKKLLITVATLSGLIANQAFARDQIKIVGSSTVYPFATVVAERLGSRGVMKTPVVESTGTGGGIKLFCSGIGSHTPDITNASRAIKTSEIEQCKKNGVKEIVEIVIGNDGIAFANNIDAPSYDFSKQQLWKAMAAKGPQPKTWKEVDPKLPDTQIEILTPPPTSGTRDAWNELVMMQGCPAEIKSKDKDSCKLMREDGAVVDAGENDALLVQKLGANRNAFAIFGFSYLDSNYDKIKAARIDGVEISLDAIQAGDYPISRPLFFYVKKAHISLIPGIENFIHEFTSPAALGREGYLVDLGLVPLNEKKLQQVRKRAKNLETV